jgi:hypothetical protein
MTKQEHGLKVADAASEPRVSNARGPDNGRAMTGSSARSAESPARTMARERLRKMLRRKDGDKANEVGGRHERGNI